MFERTLQDLIRGLRAHKASSKAQEDAFIAEAMVEIREELRGRDMALKAEGVLKICYLMMLYPIPAPPEFAFHVVEVMSSPRYHLKQIGYLAAPMAFSGDTEEVVLTVNGIKKDLMSPHVPLPPLPLTALPHLLSLSPSLSTTLHPDLLHLLTHSSPRIRKRAVLCLLPCWEAFPEGLREGFPRLRERLQDFDQGVVGATVGVVMELARRQGGKNYLPLAPELFGILTGSTNNWMLIKVVKLFAILTPLEPRLVRKLLPPITSLISSTSAISLLYECVRTCIVGGMLDPDRAEGEALARVCVEKLGGYLRDEGGDQNLRYIALLAMVKIIPTHPSMVAEYQYEIMESLDDSDVSIRMRALELVTSMVDRDNLQTIADQLLSHLAPLESNTSTLPSAVASLTAIANQLSTTASKDPATTSTSVSLSPAYRLLLTQKLLSIISYDTYVNVTDFEWVISVLIDLAYVSHVDVGQEIKGLVLDVVGRVKSVRQYAVGVLEKVLADEDLRERGRDGTGEDGLIEAAIWVCGEYSSYLSSPLSAISSILSPTLHLSSSSLISLSLHAAAKIFGHYAASISSSWSFDRHEECKALVTSIKSGLEPFLSTGDIEVQERAFEFTQLLNFVQADLNNHIPPSKTVSSSSPISDIPEIEGGFADSALPKDGNPPYPKSLFLFEPLFTSHELNAVAYKAQEAVRIPDELNLDLEVVPQGGFGDLSDEDEESEEEKPAIDLGEGGGEGMEELRRVLREQEKKGKRREGETKEERAKRRAARKAKHKDDPYYLYDKNEDAQEEDIDEIPIVKLDDSELALQDPTSISTKSKSKNRNKEKQKKEKASPPEFDRTGELPEGSTSTNVQQNSEKENDNVDQASEGLAGIDLTSNTSTSNRGSSSRFEEYKEADEDESRRNDDLAATPTAEIEVVKVKRKKKGDKKKKDKGVEG
ncbi:AP-3 complex subunit delta-1 [Kwoniella mangroviensis CBS 10435]|uniref:AP-3 complex subunit delta n=1 Tax=Kwoniella mangroviensis CBS 10435 TaxID=1331196 RepID=A0A1B9J1R8_9TREE|nr:AP-3 complex subunit delta-1 [Kwoniella mangroviensis CBS 10435]